MILLAENITIHNHERALLKNVSFNINEKDKIGVIGLNGAGKSTFLKALVGEIELEISPEFIYINASDPDGGEKKYTVTDLTKNDVFFEYNGTPHNTSIVVEDDIVTSMIKVYTP